MGRTEWVATGAFFLVCLLIGVVIGRRRSAKMLAHARQTRVTPDGWCVSRPFWKVVRFIAEHQPPRPAFWFQLRIDATSPAPIGLWLLGVNLIVIGVDKGWWGLVAGGVWVFVAYVVMLWNAARNLRDSPAVVGVIDAVKPYGLSKHGSTATAFTGDGQAIQVCVLTSLVSEMIEGGGRAQVMFLDNPRSRPCLVLAARAPPSHSPELEANVDEYANSSSNSPDSSHTC